MNNTSSGLNKFAKALYLIVIVLFLYLPIGTLMVLSFNSSKSMASWQGFSLKWYREMFANEELMEALGNTLTIALWASIIATVIGVMACVAMSAMTDRKRNIFMGLNNIPLLNADIVTGMKKTSGEYVEIPDRKEAIAYAIRNAQDGDVIVLAGKGHEDYQEIKGVKYPMDERVLIEEILVAALAFLTICGFYRFASILK